jgi:hypothetical protein
MPFNGVDICSRYDWHCGTSSTMAYAGHPAGDGDSSLGKGGKFVLIQLKSYLTIILSMVRHY